VGVFASGCGVISSDDAKKLTLFASHHDRCQ